MLMIAALIAIAYGEITLELQSKAPSFAPMYSKNYGETGALNADVVIKNIATDTEYYAQVGLGTPPQTFLLSVDTQSSDLWIGSYECKTGACFAHKRFNPKRSSSYVAGNGSLLDVPFHHGTLQGKVSTEVVTLGSLQVTSSFTEIVQEPRDLFNDVGFDGMLGLGMSSFLKQESMVSLILSSWGESGSKLIVGGYHDSDFKSNLTWYPSHQNQWALDIHSISVFKNNKTSFAANSVRGILSSEFTLMGLPTSSFKALNLALGGVAYKDAYIVSCGGPDVIIKIGEVEYVLSADDYSIPIGLTMCVSAFTHVPELDESSWVLGSLFIRKYAPVFDYKESRVGLAESTYYASFFPF